MTSNHGKFDEGSPERIARGIPRRHALTDGRSFQARELAAKSDLSPGQVAHLARLGFTREQIASKRINPFNAHEHTPGAPVERELYVLIGANAMMARYWCDERAIRRSEIGRTVFPTSMDPDTLRGRRGPVTRVYAPDDGRRWDDRDLFATERLRIRQWNREIDFLNAVTA